MNLSMVFDETVVRRVYRHSMKDLGLQEMYFIDHWLMDKRVLDALCDELLPSPDNQRPVLFVQEPGVLESQD